MIGRGGAIAPLGSVTTPNSASSPAGLAVRWNSDTGGARRLQVFRASPSEEEAVFDHNVALKVLTSNVAMHLDEAWRRGLFNQMDQLLSADDWDFEDRLPSEASFRTFLRMIVHNRPKRRPGLGATSDGRIIAAWTSGADRLTVECGENDQVKWIASLKEGDEIVRGAMTSPVQHLRKYLAPYRPERWFG